MWKEAVVVYFKTLLKHCPGGTGKSHEKPVKARPRSETGTFGIQVKLVKLSP
jgi:hypothetical protein